MVVDRNTLICCFVNGTTLICGFVDGNTLICGFVDGNTLISGLSMELWFLAIVSKSTQDMRMNPRVKIERIEVSMQP